MVKQNLVMDIKNSSRQKGRDEQYNSKN